MCQKHIFGQFLILFLTPALWLRRCSNSCQNVSKNLRVNKCLYAPACQKTKPAFSRDVSCQNVSTRCKTCQKHMFLILWERRNVYQSPADPTQPGQKVSKHVKTFQKTLNIRENTMFFRSVKTCQYVSKRIKKQSRLKMYQKHKRKHQQRIKNMSLCVNACQNVSKK